MEVTNAVYSTYDTAEIQPQEQLVTVHVNPSTDEDPINDGMSKPTDVVQMFTPVSKESPEDFNTEETH